MSKVPRRTTFRTNGRGCRGYREHSVNVALQRKPKRKSNHRWKTKLKSELKCFSISWISPTSPGRTLTEKLFLLYEILRIFGQAKRLIRNFSRYTRMPAAQTPTTISTPSLSFTRHNMQPSTAVGYLLLRNLCKGWHFPYTRLNENVAVMSFITQQATIGYEWNWLTLADASCLLTRWQHFVVWNDVISVIMKVGLRQSCCVFTVIWRIFLPNFTPIRLKTTEP